MNKILAGIMAALGATAQNAGPTLSERILEIRRDIVPPDKWLDYRAAEAASAGNCENSGCAKPYLMLTTVTGEPEAWRISTWERFGVMERGSQRYHGPRLHDGSARLATASTPALAIYREDLSGPPAVSLPNMRYFSISIVEARPGKTSDYEEVRRMIRGARLRNGAKDHNFVYQAVSGMRDGTFLIVTPMRDLREAEEIKPMIGQPYEYAMPENERSRLRALIGASVRNSQSKLFLVSPELSYPPPEWREIDGQFWRVSR